jgi:hypothetical protein
MGKKLFGFFVITDLIRETILHLQGKQFRIDTGIQVFRYSLGFLLHAVTQDQLQPRSQGRAWERGWINIGYASYCMGHYI